MVELGERLHAAMKSRDVDISKLAAAVGMSYQGIRKIVRGETREITAKNCGKIADYLHIDPMWLATGEGRMEGAAGGTKGGATRATDAVLTLGPMTGGNVQPAPSHGLVPVISWVQAGHWAEIVDNFAPGEADEWIPCPFRHGPRTFVLLVRGFSMYNPGGDFSFKDGDKIFVDPDRGATHRSLVIARLDDASEATFKQLLVEGDQRMLQALNPQWPDRIIRINGNATICGTVVGKLESYF